MKFLNTRIDNLTMEQAVDRIDHMVRTGYNQYVVTPNVDHIVRLEKDVHFRKIYEEASLVLTDGQPLIWFSRLLKIPIVEKVSGSDLFPKVCERAAIRGSRVFLLGAGEGVAVQAAERLKKKYRGLQIAGVYSPPCDFEKDQEELEKIYDILQKSQPEILAIGLGTPKQERFFYNHRDYMRIPVVLHIGATIDFEAGAVKRAPVWMSRMGFEWLYRLMKEPRRLAKRYLVDDLSILKIVWKYRKNR